MFYDVALLIVVSHMQSQNDAMFYCVKNGSESERITDYEVGSFRQLARRPSPAHFATSTRSAVFFS